MDRAGDETAMSLALFQLITSSMLLFGSLRVNLALSSHVASSSLNEHSAATSHPQHPSLDEDTHLVQACNVRSHCVAVHVGSSIAD